MSISSPNSNLSARGAAVSISNPPPAANENLTSERVHLVQHHLERVLASKAFAGNPRSKDFLRLILEHSLAGHKDNLKERLIGAEMFGRPIDCDMANDAVVRVKADEIRRRLAQHYAEEGTEQDPVWIDLPTGTCVPEFHWASARPATSLGSSTEAQAPPPGSNRISKRGCLWLQLATVSVVLGLVVYAFVNGTRPAPLPAAGLRTSLNRLKMNSGYISSGATCASNPRWSDRQRL